MNYLNEMGDSDSSGLVGVMAVSTPWNCMESCESLEQPINSFLFNQHLTRNLVNMLHRYWRFQKLWEDWVLAFSDLISGIVWVTSMSYDTIGPWFPRWLSTSCSSQKLPLNDPRYLASALSKCFVAVDNIEGVVGSKHQVPLPARAGLLVKSNVE